MAFGVHIICKKWGSPQLDDMALCRVASQLDPMALDLLCRTGSSLSSLAAATLSVVQIFFFKLPSKNKVHIVYRGVLYAGKHGM